MWRYIHLYIPRGIRARTPAPPSQTTSRNDDNENTQTIFPVVSHDNAETSSPIDAKSIDSAQVKRSTSASFQHVKDIVDRANNSPSDADVLLREFFGKSWKGTNSGKDHADFKYSHIEQLGTGLTLGSAFIVFGRAMLSNWKGKRRRSQIFNDRITSWPNCEQQFLQHIQTNYIHPSLMKSPKGWLPRLAILPSTLSPSSVLAAGGETTSQHSIQSQSITDHAAAASLGSRSRSSILNNITSSTSHTENIKRSVTFDKDVIKEEELSDSPSASEDHSITERDLEQFTEETRDCSGATFNILGLQCARSGDYKQAIDCFHLGSSEGHAKSLFNLALCYHKGLGTQKNMSKAMEMYDRAAIKGHTFSQYNLAVLLMEKGGVPNQIHAIRLLEKAAFKGFVKAQSYLGVFYTKEGDFHDMEKALKMFKQASESGDAISKYHLGICYKKGMGVEQDLSKAFDLYSSAATANHLDAQYNMANMLETGFTGTEKNPCLAKELFESAAKAGHEPSISRLKELNRKEEKQKRSSSRLNQANPNEGFEVYYSKGSIKPPNSYRAVIQPCPNTSQNRQVFFSEAEIKDGKQGYNECEITSKKVSGISDILSAELSRMMSDSAQNSLSLGRQQDKFNFQLPLNNTSTDLAMLFGQANLAAPSQFLNLRRSSTSPANLCFHAPLVREPINPFSLEV